jgi:GxxExxY protein
MVLSPGMMAPSSGSILLVENTPLVELKAVRALDGIHLAQCLKYLKATDLRRCLLLNFGQPGLEIKRVVHGL